MMMKNLLFKKTSLILLGIFLSVVWADARDIYVSVAGGGDGSTSAVPMSYTDLISASGPLRTYNVNTDDTELNVYFEAGTYTITSANFIQFNSTAANVAGLTATFQPTDPDAARNAVIFDGQNSAIRAVLTTGGSAASMTVVFNNVTFQNFNTSSGSTNGTTSVFTASTYSTITLDNVHVNNVTSARNPFVSIGGNAVFNIEGGSLIQNVNNTSAYAWYETENTGETFNINQAEFYQCKTPDNNGSWRYMFWLENADATLSINNATFRENSMGRALLASNNSSSSITVTNSAFTNNYSAGNDGILSDITNNNIFTIKDCTFSGNYTNSTSGIHLFYVSNSSSLEISGSTFTNQTMNNNAYILRLYGNDSRLVYNNTFSGNTFGDATGYDVYLSGSTTGGIFNNTFYNSGGIYNGSNMNIMNNLLIGSKATISNNNNYVQRNVINDSFYATGTVTETQNIPNSSTYLTGLQNNAVNGKPQVHNFAYPDATSNPFTKLGGAASLTGYGSRLKFDQNLMQRPLLISVGSIDDPDFILPAVAPNYRYIYHGDTGLDGTKLEIDLSDMQVPIGADVNTNVTFTIDSISNGTFTNGPAPYLFEFYPKTDDTDPTVPAPDIVGTRFRTTYHVSYTNSSGITYSATGALHVTIISSSQPPMGQVDESTLNCFTSFDAVTFKAGFKYYTGDTSINPSGAGNYTDGFSLPLVGDLNGDGKPEIVAMSQENNLAEARSQYLYIFNGQTGKIIIKHTLPVTQTNRGGGYHGTPSQIALVDADRNGRGEIIVAMGYHTSGSVNQWDKRLICYEVNEKTFDDEGINGTNPTEEDRLSMKWVSDRRYDWTEVASAGTTANNFNFSYTSGSTTKTVKTIIDNTGYCYNALPYFSTPLPQIVDFNGDGVPEIYVYNKIYNAITGELIMKFEELGPANALGNYADVDYSNINNFAFVGRDRTARNSGGGIGGDTNAPFAYIYDLDKDGKYDIAAGGKVYYNIDLVNKTYDIIKDVPTYPGSASYLIDGHTGVADINSDGIPEVVVLTRTPGNTSNSSPLILTVWNPGFFQLDTDGITVIQGNNVPEVIARLEIPVSYTQYGNHSYVYISDIDGLVQEVNLPGGGTIKKKFPEISVLSGRMFGSSGNNIPLHPNVAADLGPKLSGAAGNKYIDYGTIDGSLISFTWDGNGTDYNDRLKASFVLLHLDNSNNTAFTLFDFDNDGKMDICYRDWTRLRIISAEAPYYVNSTDITPEQNPLIKFATDLPSHTGFECPVIADIDGDSSADIIVMGGPSRSYRGYVYAIQGEGVRFAPAPKVWNQFMYSPLKINEDLTAPVKVFDPLASEFAYSKKADPDYVKDYIYNNTITQTTIFSIFQREENGTTYDVWEPIVRQPDAVVTTHIVTTPANAIVITIQNTGSSTLNASNPIVIYQATKGSELNGTNYYGQTTIGTDLFPGEETTITFPVGDPNLDYVIRVSDASLLTGNFTPDMWETTFLECNWETNISYASSFQANDDALVTEPYKSITFNVIDNDDYPSSCTPTATFTLPTGTSWGSATTDPDGTVVYTAPARYPDGVVEFTYVIECSGNTKTGNVYIYIVENSNESFAACYGSDITIDLKEQPTGTTFDWYSDAGGTTSIVAPTTISNLITPQTYYVHPRVSSPYNNISFPLYELIIRPIGNSTGNANMRWTGTIDSDWNNPNNWVLVDGGTETATSFAPAKCVDVEIPAGRTNYPSLINNGSAAFVSLKDRAMLANTHKLDYDSASVEINFTAGERDRWVMYSAPLRKVYSGDYILRTPAGEPIIKPDPSTYINYFQMNNPDRPEMVATARAFTKPVGNVEVPLPLGKSFNVWLDTDVDTSTPFYFPNPIDQFEYWVHGPWGGQTGDSLSAVLDRTDGLGNRINGRFIVEDATSTANGSFTITPPDDKEGFSLIMLPNPFMAYMDMNIFLNDNASVLNQEYKIWSGIDDTFISYKLVQGYNYQYWWVTDGAPLDDLAGNQYISPFQSFIASKTTAATDTKINVTYNSETITSTRQIGGSDYQLRNINTTPEGLLTIKATVGNYSNSTVLVNSPVSQNSFDDNDAIKLFYDNELGKQQISIYTLTPDEIPLAINSANNFSNIEIPLGVRLNVQGNIQFDFSGAEYFGVSPIYLIDGNQEIDIINKPVYSTTISGAKGFYEVNDRFRLSFRRNTVGAENENRDSDIAISVKNNKVYVTSGSIMNAVEIISSIGSTVYRSETPSLSYAIDVQSAQVYIVKIYTGKDVVARKIIVK